MPLVTWIRFCVGLAAALLIPFVVSGCGGGGSDNTPPPAGNQPPVAQIASPALGATFRAGDTINFSGSATDPEDGVLPTTGLTWWAELHHDTHTHPFRQPSAGGTGTASIPTRGETSDNIFYRFHLRATDSAGSAVEVTRDVMPQKSMVTLATQPAGLALTLDGQSVTGPHSFTGVVGIERDVGAADQVFNGRRWRFDNWNDGGAAAHTIATPSASTTFTATFSDLGPVNNQAPSVSLQAPATANVGSAVNLSATASDTDGTVTRVEFFDGTTSLGIDTSAPYAVSWTPATSGSRSITARATDNNGAATTSSAVTVLVNPASGSDQQAPTITLTAPANLASNLSGTITVSANASDNVGVASVEFQLDGMAIGAADTSAPYQTTVNTAAHTSGQHVLRARARDAAGNVSGWATALVRFGGTVSLPQGFVITQPWVGGFASATAFAQSSDGRFFVAEQGGALRVVKNGAVLPTPFVRLSNVDSNGERGLIGVALHPNFAITRWVYVHYTTTAGGVHNRISRFTANGDVVAGGETVLVDLPALSSATNHNGGAMHFGADGKLYVAVGDNGDTRKPQNLADPMGKLLRFNDDGSIPSDNPYFATQTGLARAVWASGLRNPFTFAVQPSTGRIHINDVGQGLWEEINVGAPGANYGWPESEGPDNVRAGVTGPLLAYGHSDTAPPGSGPGGFLVGLAITGGAFYPDSGPFPAGYRNQYYFSDYVERFVARLDLANGNAAYSFARLSDFPLGMLVGVDGALYVLTQSWIVRISV
jgi:glucose/arabinose dehydrogenase